MFIRSYKNCVKDSRHHTTRFDFWWGYMWCRLERKCWIIYWRDAIFPIKNCNKTKCIRENIVPYTEKVQCVYRWDSTLKYFLIGRILIVSKLPILSRKNDWIVLSYWTCIHSHLSLTNTLLWSFFHMFNASPPRPSFFWLPITRFCWNFQRRCISD